MRELKRETLLSSSNDDVKYTNASCFPVLSNGLQIHIKLAAAIKKKIGC